MHSVRSFVLVLVSVFLSAHSLQAEFRYEFVDHPSRQSGYSLNGIETTPGPLHSVSGFVELSSQDFILSAIIDMELIISNGTNEVTIRKEDISIVGHQNIYVTDEAIYFNPPFDLGLGHDFRLSSPYGGISLTGGTHDTRLLVGTEVEAFFFMEQRYAGWMVHPNGSTGWSDHYRYHDGPIIPPEYNPPGYLPSYREFDPATFDPLPPFKTLQLATLAPETIPEPSSLTLYVVGSVILGARVRRRFNS